MDNLSIRQNNQRVLVISGGGARGAWGGGLINAIYEQEAPDYRCIVGTSTGSLLAPFVALNAYAKMKEGFTDVTQESIFNVNPFKKNGDVNGLKAVWRIIQGKQTLGESDNLKERILSFFTSSDYDKLKASGRTVKASVVSLTTNCAVCKSSDDNDYTDMVDWIWASANTPVFMSALPKGDELWVDGGIKENVPVVEALEYALQHGIDTIDIVVNYPETISGRWPQPGGKTNIIPKLLRIIDVFCDEVRSSDIEIGVLRAKAENMKIYLYYMSPEEYNLCPKNLFFKKDIMEALWKQGHKHPLKTVAVKTVPLPGNNVIYYR